MFHFSTIRTKISVSILAIFILFLGAYTLFQVNNIRQHAFETLESINTTVNTILVNYTSAYIYNNDTSNIQLSIDAIHSKYIKAIYILNQEGFIIAKNQSEEVPYTRYEKFEYLCSLEGQSIKTTKEYTILNTFEILDIPIGYMVVEGNLDTYDKHLKEELDGLAIGALLSIALFLLATIVVARSVSHPIEEIVKKLQKSNEGEVLDLKKQPQKEFEYLSNVISSTHNRLRESNLNLEAEVNKKTYELQELNTHLEVKIKEAIIEVEHKNKILKQNSRMAQMGEMISMIAHQWRQPLAAISAVCIDLRMKITLEDFELETKEGKKEMLDYTENSLISIDNFVQNLTQTVDDFRNFHKTDKLQDLSQINVPIKKALNIIRGTFISANINLQESYESKMMLSLYTNELMQVILNILKNAQDSLKNTSKQRESSISIRTYDTDSHAVIEIEDNGGGIKEEYMDKIYDPYFSTKDEKNGTGLGLYMSKTIIQEHHKGELNAFNTDDGVCFVIKLNIQVNS